MVTERAELPYADENDGSETGVGNEENMGEDYEEFGAVEQDAGPDGVELEAGEFEDGAIEHGGEPCGCGHCVECGGERPPEEAKSGKDGLGIRFASALVMLTAAGAAIWLGGWYLFGLVAAVSLGAVSEYMNLAEARGFSPNRYLVSLCSLTALAAYEILGDNIPVAAACCLAVLIWTLFSSGLDVILNPDKHKSALADSAVNCLAVIYCGILPALLLNLRRISVYALIFVVIICILSDAGGYFFGRAFGKSKLCPKVSPGKTWAGFWGALLCCTAFAGISGYYIHSVNAVLHLFPLWLWALAGLILSVAAQLGDLFESALKRDAGIKDSGSIIPGHGGVLDRFDSYLFASVFAYLFVIAGIFYLESFLSSSPM